MGSLRGKTELEVFKNFYRERGDYLRGVIEDMKFSSKDDATSIRLSEGFETHFREKNFSNCLEMFTDSLRYANYNSNAYAEALRKRSDIYFILENFENAAIDLGLCIEADYAANDKFQAYIEKAKCYANMKMLKKMLETIEDLYHFITHCSDMSEELKAKYLEIIKSFRKNNDFNLGETELLHPLIEAAYIKEPHPLNPNVSSSVRFRCNTAEIGYVAARDIPYGEVLFLENAYSTSNSLGDSKGSGVFFCDYCLAEARNCIPCRTCVTPLYCSEYCRVSAWDAYHQWECDIIRANFLPIEMTLSLRTVIKAACSGSIRNIVSKKPIKPGKNVDPYLDMYSVQVDFVDLRLYHNQKLFKCCDNSVMMVEFLKKTTFFSYLMHTVLYNLSFDELVDRIGGLLLRHNVQSLQRSITVNRPSPVISMLDESIPSLVLSCFRIIKFNAFCPMVSRLPHSCIANTIIDFQGYTAVVKASKDIKAGERIYRSTQNISPNMPCKDRKNILDSSMIICKCEACRDIKKNCEIYNTFICTACKGIAVLENEKNPYVKCLDCNIIGTTSLIAKELAITDLALVSGDLKAKQNCVRNINSVINPHHHLFYVVYKSILHQKRSQKGYPNKFKRAFEDFKNCSKTRTTFGDPYDYLDDVIFMCEAFFRFLEMNKENIKKEEGLELINVFLTLIEEVKKIAVVFFQPFLQLLLPIELYLVKYRINHIYFKAE